MKKSGVGFIRGGKLEPLSKRNYDFALQAFEDGTKITWTIQNYVREKSLGQINLIHKLFSVIAKELGYFPHQIKEHVKNEYGVWESMKDRKGNEMVNLDTGEVVMVAKSLADYSVEEMTDLINVVYEFSKERNIKLPHPEDLRNYNIPL